MFDLPQSEATRDEGSSDENPIVLSGITADEFRYFLQVLCPQISLSPLQVIPIILSEEGWIAVLRLATMWKCTTLRMIALEKLLDASSFTKLQLSRAYGIREWLLPSLTELAFRDQFLTLEEGTALGLESVVKIGRARDTLLREYKKAGPIISPYIWLKNYAETIVGREFALPLKIKQTQFSSSSEEYKRGSQILRINKTILDVLR